MFGFVVCLDSFLYTFPILPIRFVLATLALLRNTIFRVKAPPFPPSEGELEDLR